MKSVWFIWPFLATNLVVAESAAVPLLPIETFFRSPSLTEVQLAPDGKYIAAIKSDKGRTLLLSINLETGERKALIAGPVYGLDWVSDQRLLYRAGGVASGALVAVNRDGTTEKILAPGSIYQFTGPDVRVQFAHLLSRKCAAPDCVLMEKFDCNPRIGPRLLHPDVYRLNYFTGEFTLEENNPGDVTRWLADPHGTVRAAVAVVKNRYKLLFRRDRQQAWHTIFEADLAADHIIPLGFASASNELYVATRNGTDTLGIYTFDTANHTVGARLWHHNHYDVHAALTYGPDEVLRGVIYESDRPEIEWLDDAAKITQANVDQSLPRMLNLPVSCSRDGMKFLYLCSNDRTPGSFYLVNLNPQGIGAFGHTADWIKSEQMAEMKPIEYRARDGLTIHGYLTLPLGSAGTNLAMIVIPHGGPWVRDSWGFDPEVQFFANRGYAVLQMNFRGSTGYGQAFYKAGFKELGHKMQDDVTDGVQWAIDRRIADKKRIAIYGASYGGYAALMGLITTPHLYRCAVSYAGVTDLRATQERAVTHMPKPFAAIQQERVGDYRSEKDELEAVSPLKHVDDIQAPLFLAYAGADPIVDVEQGKKLAKALKKRGNKYELVIEPCEGHGFHNETNRFNLFRKVETFLKENLSDSVTTSP
jgi:dipeptidyl aminopeptidase/acylaminoacyl peptidase